MELLVLGARAPLDLHAVCAAFTFDKLYLFGAAIDAANRIAQGPTKEQQQAYLDRVEAHLRDNVEGAPPPLPSVPAYLEQTVAVGPGLAQPGGPDQAVEFWGSRLVMFAASTAALPDEEADLHNADLWVVGGQTPRLDDVRDRPVLCPGEVDTDGSLLRLTLARQGARALVVDPAGKVLDERTIGRRKSTSRMVVR